MALKAVRMKGKNAPFGSMAECFITIDGKRYNFMSFTKFESKTENSNVDIPILGQTTTEHKHAGSKGTWSGTAYYNQSVFRKIADKFQKTGVSTYFEIQTTNEDPSSGLGRQTIILHNCLMDSFVLAKFEAGESVLEEELSGTFDSWDMPEEFTPMDGFEM